MVFIGNTPVYMIRYLDGVRDSIDNDIYKFLIGFYEIEKISPS